MIFKNILFLLTAAMIIIYFFRSATRFLTSTNNSHIILPAFLIVSTINVFLSLTSSFVQPLTSISIIFDRNKCLSKCSSRFLFLRFITSFFFSRLLFLNLYDEKTHFQCSKCRYVYLNRIFKLENTYYEETLSIRRKN